MSELAGQFLGNVRKCLFLLLAAAVVGVEMYGPPTKPRPVRGRGSVLRAIPNNQPKLLGRQHLRLGDLAALDAACAHADALGRAVDKSLDGLEVNVPAPARHIVRVRDVVTELRPLAANITYLCHGSTPESLILTGFGTPERRF